MPRLLIWALSAGMMALGAGGVTAQNYPTKPIRIVAAGPGGTGDFVARLVGQGLTVRLGQQVVVENRAAGGGIIAAQTVAQAAPDGYTLLSYGPTIWLLPFLRRSVPYDPVRDFSPVTSLVTAPNLLVVHPSLPAKSVKELIALAKARPGELNYGSGATGATPHLAAELFKTMAGVDIVRINYKSTGQALNDLIAGQVQLMFSSAAAGLMHVKSGRLRALAVTSAQPSALFPGMPTVAAAGLPGYESASIFAVFAPAKTPAALIHRLNQEIVRVLNGADAREKLLNSGLEAVGSSPEEFAATMKSEMARWGKVIKDAGIRPD
ncbi:MAG: tripartite tricarboxylate transporter substrate binding protein [Betaproteobacteria bacterium]|nr:tripartite tricarboxylate transporter substrate binding protein [Betaproteobacteria bacterium]MBI3938720.1 tripartite tricarboxylate transporter substrate binding protein [Betaproteobacteria bacterium]